MRWFHRTQSSQKTQQPSVTTAIAPASQPQSLEALEQQMAIEAHSERLQLRPQTAAAPFIKLRRLGHRLLWGTVLLGIPVGAIALINLPYAPIRRPIAEKAPLLLMPSYINMDQNLRQAIANVESAKQLIDDATAATDLELGEQKVKQAQANLDQLPTWVWSELPNTRSWWWYNWRLSPLSFNQARAEIGRLQSKVFQEKNAQTALVQAEQALGLATQQTQEAQTPAEKLAALRVWQDALDQLHQIPASTLAGRMAQQKLAATQREFEAISGSTSQNIQTLTLISAAREFAGQAAQASQHPPHSVEKWQQSANLWQEAIDRLEKISLQDDPVGYGQAQKLLATYKNNYDQIKMRQQAETEAVAAFNRANEKISRLIDMSQSASNRSQSIGQLQQIIGQLEAIGSGTTVYPEARKLLISAKLKQQEWQN